MTDLVANRGSAARDTALGAPGELFALRVEPDVEYPPTSPSNVTHPQSGTSVTQTYTDASFVARYASVWAFGDADPERTCEPYYRHLLQVATDADATPTDILDVGCGPGRLLADLARSFPEARCVGVDYSAAMIDIARRILHSSAGDRVDVDASDFGFAPVAIPGRGRPDIELECASLVDYHRSGRRHDLVVASHLLDRTERPTRTLDTLADLVTDDGLLLVSCAFNYSHRTQWTLRTAQDLVGALIALGFLIEHADDNVSYAERLDIRGTTTHHRVAVVRARKPRGH